MFNIVEHCPDEVVAVMLIAPGNSCSLPSLVFLFLEFNKTVKRNE